MSSFREMVTPCLSFEVPAADERPTLPTPISADLLRRTRSVSLRPPRGRRLTRLKSPLRAHVAGEGAFDPHTEAFFVAGIQDEVDPHDEELARWWARERRAGLLPVIKVVVGLCAVLTALAFAVPLP